MPDIGKTDIAYIILDLSPAMVKRLSIPISPERPQTSALHGAFKAVNLRFDSGNKLLQFGYFSAADILVRIRIRKTIGFYLTVFKQAVKRSNGNIPLFPLVRNAFLYFGSVHVISLYRLFAMVKGIFVNNAVDWFLSHSLFFAYEKRI